MDSMRERPADSPGKGQTIMANDKTTAPAANVDLLDGDDLGRGLAKRDRKPSRYDDVVGQLTAAFRETPSRVLTGRIVSKDAAAQKVDLNELRRAGAFHGVQLKTRKQGGNELEVRFQVKGNR